MKIFILLLTFILTAAGIHAQNPAVPETESSSQSLTAGAAKLKEDATLFPVPEYDGPLSTRAALTGDWGGTRITLAKERGIQFSLDVHQFYQGIWDGGRDSRSDYNGSADYRLKFDSSAAGLWPGGFLEIHGETYWGSNVNGQTGAILPVNIDPSLNAPGGNGTYLSHVAYTQFLSEKLAFTIGKMDTTLGDSNRFAHGVGDQRFMNLGFSFNPVTVKNAPYSTLGAGVVWLPNKDLTLTLSIFDTDGRIDESGFDTIFNGNTTFAIELAMNTNFIAQPGRHTAGMSYSNKDFLSLEQDPRLSIPRSDGPLKKEDGSWALYYNFDQFLVSNPDDPSQGWGLFGRFGLSDGKANILHQFYSVGLGGVGIIPGRDRDRFGLGYYYLKLSNDRIGLLTDDSEQGIEVFYNIAITPWFEVSTDLQVVDGAGRFADTAVVGGLRARIVF